MLYPSLLHTRTQQKGIVCKPRRSSPQEQKQQDLGLGFPVSGTLKHEFLLSRPPHLWNFVAVVQAELYSRSMEPGGTRIRVPDSRARGLPFGVMLLPKPGLKARGHSWSSSRLTASPAVGHSMAVCTRTACPLGTNTAPRDEGEAHFVLGPMEHFVLGRDPCHYPMNSPHTRTPPSCVP